MVDEIIDKKRSNKESKRNIHPNSLKNLRPVKKGEVRNPSGRPKKDCSITSIQKGMLVEKCPYAKDPSWTWAYTLAEAGMKDALTDEKVRENLKDRFEGKITQPIGGEGGQPIKHEIIVSSDTAKRLTKAILSGEGT